MIGFFVGFTAGVAIAGVAFKASVAIRYLLPPAAATLFIHALGVVEKTPHWAITTVEMTAAVAAILVSSVVWLVWRELENARKG